MWRTISEIASARTTFPGGAAWVSYATEELQAFEALLLVQLEQRRTEIIQVSLHDLVKVEVFLAAAFAAQAVVGAAILGEVVGSDALGAVAGAHHGPACADM